MRLRLLAVLPLLLLGSQLVPNAQAASPVYGVDVSKYQHPNGKLIDWAKVKASGRSFAFIKATGGTDRVDPWFAREWAAAGRAGMIRGAYHFADPSRPADAQAALIVSVVGTTRETNNLGIVLDLERTGGLSPSKLGVWTHAFLSGVERRTGRVPIIYSGPSFWRSKMGGNRSFGAYPLWLAHYTSKTPGPLPGWNRWTFWQHTSSARVPGIPTRVDHNRFCCAAGVLQGLADGRSTAIARLWRGLGGASGKLGLPLGPETAVRGGWAQTYEKGLITSTRQGTWAVLGDDYVRYVQTGGLHGPLGVPTSSEVEVAPGVSRQYFVGGQIIRSAATGAHALHGPVLSRWLVDGGISAPEGLPTGELTDVSQQFAKGGLYVTASGVRLVPGAIRDRYEQLGGPRSTFGLPTAEPREFLGATVVDFQVGQLYEFVVGNQRIVI